MGGRIPDEAIQDIRDRVNLVELISERTSLRKRGRNFVGLCPFHAENTPSFTVSEERGFFHCFGCGASGNAFSWVMRAEGMEFPDAVRMLAARVGVKLPAFVSGRRDRSADDLLYRVNKDAAAFYERVLWDQDAGRPAREYLGQRGIDEAVARTFGLGFAPVANAYAGRVRAKSIPVEATLSVGILARRADGSLVDRFRGRLLFPIRDVTGRVVGFGGRVLPGAPPDAPKYLNSAENALFKKRQLLYGLPEARDTLREADRAILVEGYMDVLALHQHGVRNAVAPLGTALTAEQLRGLRRHASDVVACFDADAAGLRAAARSFPVFVEAGIWGRAALLPRGDDPDTFVRRQGREAFEQILAGARPLLDIFLETLVRPEEPSIGRRVQAAREVGRLLRRVRNPWEYDVLARRAAERLGVGEQLLRAEGGNPQGVSREQPSRPRPGAAGEGMLIELMLTGRDAVERVAREGGLELFEDRRWRQLAEAILARVDSGADFTEILDQLPDEMRSRVAASLLAPDSESKDRDRLIDDCIAFIHRRRGRRQVRQALEELRAAEASGDPEQLKVHMERWRALVKRENENEEPTLDPEGP